jgi:hypothetical protein
MTRELNQLIKKLKTLSPDDIARVQQFLLQLKSPELRSVPVELKAIPGEARTTAPALAGSRDAGAAQPGRREAIQETSPEAEVAHAACAQWRRRPFQAIDADDLQPIAALFREAVDTRAASRFRFGSR